MAAPACLCLCGEVRAPAGKGIVAVPGLLAPSATRGSSGLEMTGWGWKRGRDTVSELQAGKQVKKAKTVFYTET